MSFKLKLLISFIIYGLSLVIFTQFAVFKLHESNLQKSSIQTAKNIFFKKDALFERYVKDINLKLKAIKNSQIFIKYQTDGANLSDLESLFLDIANTSESIMQLRYIDKNGIEIVRIDRDTYSSNAYVIALDDLQDKSNRYYFQESYNNLKDEFWYSKLDLNMEYGEIVKPIKPVLRISIPTFYNNKKTGVLVINIFMKKFLRELVDDSFYNIYLIDKEKNIMIDPEHKNCWSKYLNTKNYSKHDFTENELKNILSSDTYTSNTFYSNKIFLNNGENIHMLIEAKKNYLQEKLLTTKYELALILFIIILISLPISYFFINIPTKLKAEVDKQNEEQEILLSLFHLGDAVLFKWNNDATWSVNFVSKSVNKLLSYTQKDFISNNIAYANCIHHDDINQVTQELEEAIKSNVYFFKHKPYRIVTKDKKIKWILDSTVIVRDKDENIINFVGYLTDITELKDNENKLKTLSRTDQLTQITNRMHLDDILQSQYYRFNRANEVCSILLLDIDHFKDVNDKHGHLVGDKILIEFASLLKNNLRVGDTLGRWGGEEFLIILPHTNLQQALHLAEKLRKLIATYDFSVIKDKTASIGVSTLEDEDTIEIFIDNADKALYKSKESGRNMTSTIQKVK